MRLTRCKFELTNSIERLLDDTQKERVKEALPFATPFLNALTSRLEKEIEDSIKEDESIKDFESPSWALLKAERLGYRRGIRKVLDILRPIKENHD